MSVLGGFRETSGTGPCASSASPDGGPLRYRVAHTARMWRAGETPKLETVVLEGDVGLSI